MTLFYVPAGVESYANKRSQLMIRNQPNENESTGFGKAYKVWYTHRKTIHHVSSLSKVGANIKAQADLVVPIYNATNVKSYGLGKVLVNPIHHEFDHLSYTQSGIKCIVDSGGFQMLKGTIPFVDPDDVIKRYNENADIGMPLDVPVEASLEPYVFDTISKLIKRNDEYIIPKLKPGIDLALISHGTNIKYREKRLDILDRKANVLAIAGLNMRPSDGRDHDFANVENLMYVVHRYRKQTEYFHILGVTKKMWLFVYGLLDITGFVKNIGGDSVSHRLSALAGDYETRDFNLWSIPKNLRYRMPLMCSCPVCSSVDDLRIIQEYTLLESHNLWVKAKQTELISELAQSFSQGTIPLKVVHTVLRLRIDMNKFQRIINYVTEIMSSGKYLPYKDNKGKATLFGLPKANQSDLDKYRVIIGKFEQYHKTKF